MKLVLAFLIIGCCISGCKNKDLSSQHLSRISVIRDTEPSLPNNNKATYTPSQTGIQQNNTQYHIIVASFSTREKARAEKMLSRLKAKDYPATLLYSSQRYRVSIESFSTEAEANAARDEYRSITDRQDIWVHKIN
ncbi:SPOR domain-containing protein [Parabacteroides goldsteinii]|uniref:SPOR domain-containing protein n=1 Tax=Parabacteroides goldsteinii TaxID=328812 RepID=UPI002570C118|nr:SPOR domain-containing protein [Parabacteroides goldsteinii]